MAILYAPTVFEDKALVPIATFLIPVVLFWSAESLIAVLNLPTVLFLNAL